MNERFIYLLHVTQEQTGEDSVYAGNMLAEKT